MNVEVRTVPITSMSAAPGQHLAALVTAGLLTASMASAGTGAAVARAPSAQAISLTAQSLPLPIQLFNEQVTFNIGLTVNWLTTGAALAQRITQVPGTFVSDLRTGTSLPAATGRAVTTFADIEFEAGRDLIGYAQQIADFQLQFRARTLSTMPPFNAGPGQQFIVATTTFGLTVVQRLADLARALVTMVQQFTHGALNTPLPVAPIKVSTAAVANIPATTPKMLVGEQHSAVSTFNSTAINVSKPGGQRQGRAVASTVGDPPKGHGAQTLSPQVHQSDSNTHRGKTHDHQPSNQGPHHH